MKHFRNQEEWITIPKFFDAWIIYFAGLKDHLSINELDSNSKKKYDFWKMFFNKLLVDDHMKNSMDVSTKELVDGDTRIIKVSKSIFVKQYKDKVYKLLEDNKNNESVNLFELQEQIENLTMNFSEENIFASCPNIMEMMTKPKLPNAKEFLLQKYKVDKVEERINIFRSEDEECLSNEEKKKVVPLLTEADKELISEFGQHTIECILIHILCYLFNIENSVSLASLIDRISSSIRQYVNLLRDNRNLSNKFYFYKEEELISKKLLEYPFGTALVEFLISRNVIVITQKNLDDIKSCEMDEGIPKKFIKSIKKKGKSFYRDKSNFAECTFNTALLPVKFSLPMVFQPLDWKYDHNQTNLSISDLYGGYLVNPTGQIYESYRIISSPNIKNFFIFFDDKEKANSLCNSISWLQRQAFQINSQFLEFIINNMDEMVINGFLKPEFLSNITMNDASKLLRECYMNYDKIHPIYKFGELVEILSKNVQQSRYEQTIIDMAMAYDGYRFYYPAFLDFRGRIYRSGIFHFHERDFARSLILLADDKTTIKEEDYDKLRKRFLIATAFHYQKFQCEEKAYTRIVFILNYFDKLSNYTTKEDKIILMLRSKIYIDCKNPFQLLANIVLYEYSKGDPKKLEQMYLSVPITQDASASAYQIMSYYLLDEKMGIRTNLIPQDHYQIEDIYEYFLAELKSYLKESLSENPSLFKVTDVLTRKIVKGIFMPMIYGKTIGSTITDLNISLSKFLVKKDSVILASNIFKFWREKYHSPQILMKFIPLLGRFVSAVDNSVCYSTPYFYTVQDYRVMSKNSVYVYDKNTRKRRRVTLTFSSEKRDKRKTETSTFVNFIHQKDAYIAIKMVEELKAFNIPIYTVHDNFISNTPNCELLNLLYMRIFRGLEPPLLSINKFIYFNIIMLSPYNERNINLEKVIPLSKLRAYLNAWKKPKSENKKKWENNIERIINYYSEYCMAVCESKETQFEATRDERWESHLRRWEVFSNKMRGIYCIHH